VRRFGDVRFWFIQRAGELYGPTVRQAAIDAFDAVGVTTPSCPTPPPPDFPPVCQTKPSLPQCDIAAPLPPAEEASVRG